MKTPPKSNTLHGAWYYIYGKGSHMSTAEKLVIGVPMFPLVALMVLVFLLFDSFLDQSQS